MNIIGLYTGNVEYIGDKRSPTGIYKKKIDQVSVDSLGIVGDIQVDKRYHGGPEKALHQFALRSYEKIIKRFPLLHKKAQLGSIGENISVEDMHEHNVFVGDIYQMGSVVVQVSSPRIPCWKIDTKFRQPDLNQFISQHKINGWYYRVLQSGKIKLDDKVILQQRPNANVSVHTMLKVIHGQADAQEAEQTINALGVDPEWNKRLQNKYYLAQ